MYNYEMIHLVHFLGHSLFNRPISNELGKANDINQNV